jgi:hypothetical protein
MDSPKSVSSTTERPSGWTANKWRSLERMARSAGFVVFNSSGKGISRRILPEGRSMTRMICAGAMRRKRWSVLKS